MQERNMNSRNIRKLIFWLVGVFAVGTFFLLIEIFGPTAKEIEQRDALAAALREHTIPAYKSFAETYPENTHSTVITHFISDVQEHGLILPRSIDLNHTHELRDTLFHLKSTHFLLDANSTPFHASLPSGYRTFNTPLLPEYYQNSIRKGILYPSTQTTFFEKAKITFSDFFGGNIESIVVIDNASDSTMSVSATAYLNKKSCSLTLPPKSHSCVRVSLEGRPPIVRELISIEAFANNSISPETMIFQIGERGTEALMSRMVEIYVLNLAGKNGYTIKSAVYKK